MLGNAAASARTTIPFAEGHCKDAELILREQVATVPFVRSVNLTRDDKVFCTSLFGPYDEPVAVDTFVDGRLSLLPGNDVTPQDRSTRTRVRVNLEHFDERLAISESDLIDEDSC